METELLLFESGIKKFNPRSDQNLLSYMAESGSTLIVRLLVDEGVEVDVSNKKRGRRRCSKQHQTGMRR